MTEKSKANLWGILNTLAILGLAQAVAWYAFFEPPWLVYQNSPFPVIEQRVHVGEAVRMIVARCNNDRQPHLYTVARQLESQRGTPIILPASAAPIEPGCHESTSAINIIPAGTPPGRYEVSGYAQVEGTIRTTIVLWRSQPFEVVAP